MGSCFKIIQNNYLVLGKELQNYSHFGSSHVAVIASRLFYHYFIYSMRFAFLVMFFVCSLVAAPPGTPQANATASSRAELELQAEACEPAGAPVWANSWCRTITGRRNCGSHAKACCTSISCRRFGARAAWNLELLESVV